MSSVHHPEEKKRLSLDRDHYSKAEQDKGRKTWRRKERDLQHAYRRRVKVTLGPTGEGEEKAAEIRREKVKKWPVTPLRASVAHKLTNRKRRIGSKICRRAQRLAHDTKTCGRKFKMRIDVGSK
jgi:hypothetical protein